MLLADWPVDRLPIAALAAATGVARRAVAALGRTKGSSRMSRMAAALAGVERIPGWDLKTWTGLPRSDRPRPWIGGDALEAAALLAPRVEAIGQVFGAVPRVAERWAPAQVVDLQEQPARWNMALVGEAGVRLFACAADALRLVSHAAWVLDLVSGEALPNPCENSTSPAALAGELWDTDVARSQARIEALLASLAAVDLHWAWRCYIPGVSAGGLSEGEVWMRRTAWLAAARYTLPWALADAWGVYPGEPDAWARCGRWVAPGVVLAGAAEGFWNPLGVAR